MSIGPSMMDALWEDSQETDKELELIASLQAENASLRAELEAERKVVDSISKEGSFAQICCGDAQQISEDEWACCNQPILAIEQAARTRIKERMVL